MVDNNDVYIDCKWVRKGTVAGYPIYSYASHCDWYHTVFENGFMITNRYQCGVSCTWSDNTKKSIT